MLAKKFVRETRLPRSVRPSNDDDVLHGPNQIRHKRLPLTRALSPLSRGEGHHPYPSALLLSFTFSASTYTSPPISRNFLLIAAMPACGSTTLVSCASSTPASFSLEA